MEGLGVALATPFTDKNKIDFSGLEKLVSHVIDHVDYLVVNGTTGENPVLSIEEKKEILEFVKEKVNNRKPIVFGLGSNNTNQLLEDINKYNLEGIAAILSSSPGYNKPSQAGLVQHYQSLADNSPLPIILYNVPSRTSGNIDAQTTIQLSYHPNIIAIKEASGDIQQCLEILNGKKKDFLLISGDDLLAVPLISIGAKGVISVMANAIPAPTKRIISGSLKDQFQEIQGEIQKLNPLIKLLFKEGNPTGIKSLLEILGICSSKVRLPLMEGSENLKQLLKTAYEFYNGKPIN